MTTVEHERTSQQEASRRFRQNQRDERNEVGKLPAVKTPELRERMLDSLEVFLSEGFPHIFTNDFGPVQKDSIRLEQELLEKGGQNLNKLEPRGYGKSIRSILAKIWATLKGCQRFCLLCCDSKEKSDDMLRLAHGELGDNDILLGCFPELACFQHLEGNSHRGNYQTYQGERTEISIKGDTIQFPKLKGFKSSGAIIAARPFRKARGKNIQGQRPTHITLDDIQSTEEATSPTAIRKNLRILRSDIAFLGDRANPISICNNATIIAPDDYADSLTRDPSFQTVRYKMVEEFPESKLWERYLEIRAEYDSDLDGDAIRARREALEFYQENREDMDDGAVVTWDYAYSRKEYDYEISTIQAAYNFIQDYGQESFDSECQNDPPKPNFDSDELSREHVRTKQHGQGRGVVPQEAEYLVCDIDVQGDVLFYTEAGGNEQFDGFITQYGTYPEQNVRHFEKKSLHKRLSQIYPGLDEDARIYQGVKDFLTQQLAKSFKRDGDGAVKQFDLLAVDVKWNEKIIRRAIRDVGDSRVLAYNGHGIGPNKAPMATWKVLDGDKKGVHWHLRAAKQGVRNLVSDVNFWKTFVKKHFLIPMGQSASLSVYKVENEAEHELYASHLKSEVGKVLVDEQSGRRVEVWTPLPGMDNDWLDTTCGCMALLSVCGAECLGAEKEKKTVVKRRAVSYF